MLSSASASQVLDAATSSPPLSTPQSPVAASKPETTPAPTAPDPAPEKVSDKLLPALQREKQALALERTIKAREDALAQREKELEAKLARVTEFEAVKQNPKKALEVLGVSYDELTKSQLSETGDIADLKIKELESKIDNFTQSQLAEKQQAEEQLQKQKEKQQEQTIANFKSEISQHLKSNAEQYELIEFENAHDLVYEVIDEHYNRTLQAALAKAEESGEDASDLRGEVMTIKDASDKVEKFLEQKYEKAKGLKKVSAFLAPRQEKPADRVQSIVDKLKTPASQPPKTLTNTMSATPTKPRARTDEDRIAAAIAYARSLRPAL